MYNQNETVTMSLERFEAMQAEIEQFKNMKKQLVRLSTSYDKTEVKAEVNTDIVYDLAVEAFMASRFTDEYKLYEEGVKRFYLYDQELAARIIKESEEDVAELEDEEGGLF